MLHFKHQALAWRQYLQSAQDLFTQFSAQQLLLWVVRSVVRDFAQQLIDVYPCRAIFSIISILPQVIQASVGGNPVDPSRQGALEPEAT